MLISVRKLLVKRFTILKYCSCRHVVALFHAGNYGPGVIVHQQPFFRQLETSKTWPTSTVYKQWICVRVYTYVSVPLKRLRTCGFRVFAQNGHSFCSTFSLEGMGSIAKIVDIYFNAWIDYSLVHRINGWIHLINRNNAFAKVKNQTNFLCMWLLINGNLGIFGKDKEILEGAASWGLLEGFRVQRSRC